MFKHLGQLHLGVRTEVAAVLAAVTAASLGSQTASAQHDADDIIRMNNSNPIIFRDMFPSSTRSDGDNIDGPSMIRIPSFIPNSRRANSNADYYLYFGHHDGDWIRMAWSANPTGPFTLFGAGASVGDRGVLDNNNTNIATRRREGRNGGMRVFLVVAPSVTGPLVFFSHAELQPRKYPIQNEIQKKAQENRTPQLFHHSPLLSHHHHSLRDIKATTHPP